MQTEQPDQNSNADPLAPTAPNSDVGASSQILAPGDVLRAERLRQNHTEKYVSDQLHITMHYVRAIESNRFDKLPGAVFAKGYIKSYALLLGLDPNELTALFDGINSEQQGMQEEATRRHTAQRRSDRNKPWMYVSAACFVLGFGGLWAFNATTGDDPDTQVTPANTPPATITSRPMAQSPAPVQVAPALPPPAPENADDRPTLATALSALVAERTADLAVAAKVIATDTQATVEDQLFTAGTEGNDVLRIDFTGESWVEVNDSQSGQIYRDIREAGDVLEIIGDAPFSILLGDAPFARMYLNGSEIDVTNDIRIDNSARLTVGL